MEDFNGLAQRVALSADDVHGCLILSRDGLVLGSYPTIDDSVARSTWLKFARSLGEPERGFVEFPDQVWVFARRGAYSAFAVGGRGIRAGVLLETVEQALLTADQSRANRDALRIPDAPSAPTGKPRTSLHPQTATREPEPEAVAVAAEAIAAEAAIGVPVEAAGAPAPEPPPAEPEPVAAEAAEVPSHDVPAAAPEPPATPDPPSEEDGEIDRVMLAQEFSGLLQVREGDDESSS